MEGSVGVADSNCDSDKHVNAPNAVQPLKNMFPSQPLMKNTSRKIRKYWKESTNFPMQEEIYPGK